MALKIEDIRKYIVGYKPAPGRPHHIYEQSSNGFLVTGYEDRGDWLVSPLGRQTWGRILRDRPNMGWAISEDRRDYHRLHLYILDLEAKSFEVVPGLKLTRDFELIPYDRDRLVVISRRDGELDAMLREMFVVDIATARIADRFVLKGLEPAFRRPIGRSPDGRVTLCASRLGEDDERLYIHGVARIDPLNHDIAFEAFPGEGYAQLLISPSGRYALKARAAARPVTQSPTATAVWFERALELWSINPFAHVRDLPLAWVDGGEDWKMPALPTLEWQADETAFWWVESDQMICVGLDGRTSPAWRFKARDYRRTALPGRAAECVAERETTFDVIRLDGSPSADLTPRDAPVPTVVTPDAAEQKRHKVAQTALTKIVRAKSDLTFTAKTAEPADILATVDAVTAALDRGLAWFATEDGIVKLSVKVAGVAHSEKRFFARVETLGAAAAPALTRLVAKCRADPDLASVWSGALEDGRQALGPAARALAGVDATAWPELAAYEMCVDEWHEAYFRDEVVPHFLKTHGWREESFALAIADIVQVRGNLGDNFVVAWRRSGVAAAAEKAYAPQAFANLMLAIRDRMIASAAGGFARFVAQAAADPTPTHGWRNFDRLAAQIGADATAWEAAVFEALQRSG